LARKHERRFEKISCGSTQCNGLCLACCSVWKQASGRQAFKGVQRAGVLEVVDDYAGDTYRAVYTVKLAGVVCALHAFQKKSKKGIAMPKADIDLIRARLKRAKELYKKGEKV
jgi:phage-related protein